MTVAAMAVDEKDAPYNRVALVVGSPDPPLGFIKDRVDIQVVVFLNRLHQ